MEKMNITIASMGKPVIASVHNIAVANGYWFSSCI